MNIVNVSTLDPEWNWLATRFEAQSDLRWIHASAAAARVPAWLPPRHVWQRVAAAFLARRLAVPGRSLIVSHGPTMTMYAEAANRLRPLRARHLAYAFNFTRLPVGWRRRVQRSMFRSVDRFVVFSSVERRLYADHFDIPEERIDMIHWAMRPQNAAGEPPLVSGDYVCAVGGQGRDYATLAEAMRLLPETRLVIVATRQAMVGVSVPANVEVRLETSLAEATNIVANSLFMVLPLRDAAVPCGHVTLVSAMHLGKAVVATGSAGIADYLDDGVTGLLSPPHDAGGLATRVQTLAASALERHRLGENGRRFASAHCLEDHAVRYLQRFLTESGGGIDSQ